MLALRANDALQDALSELPSPSARMATDASQRFDADGSLSQLGLRRDTSIAAMGVLASLSSGPHEPDADGTQRFDAHGADSDGADSAADASLSQLGLRALGKRQA